MFLDSNVSGGLVGGFAPQTLDHEQYFFSKWNQHMALTICRDT